MQTRRFKLPKEIKSPLLQFPKKGRSLHDDLSKEEANSYVYHRLVENDKDVIGMIAYCQYKNAKIEHILSFYKSHGRKPTNDELKEFQDTQCNKTLVEAHRNSSVKLLEEIGTVIFKSYEEDLIKRMIEIDSKEKELVKKLTAADRILKNCPKKKSISFWESVFSSCVATILLGVLTLVLWKIQLLPSIIEAINK